MAEHPSTRTEDDVHQHNEHHYKEDQVQNETRPKRRRNATSNTVHARLITDATRLTQAVAYRGLKTAHERTTLPGAEVIFEVLKHEEGKDVDGERCQRAVTIHVIVDNGVLAAAVVAGKAVELLVGAMRTEEVHWPLD